MLYLKKINSTKQKQHSTKNRKTHSTHSRVLENKRENALKSNLERFYHIILFCLYCLGN